MHKSRMKTFVCLFELILYIPVNSYGHAGTLPPVYGTSVQQYTGLQV